MERAHMTDYLIGIDQKILDLWVSSCFWERLKKAIRSSIKPKFNVLGFNTSNVILGLWFTLNSRDMDHFDNLV